MRLLRQLWRGDAGVVVSAELMMIGTLGVVGAVSGIAAVADSVNLEMAELSRALRGFDQSYSVAGTQISVQATNVSTGSTQFGTTTLVATKAGSFYRQADPDVPVVAEPTDADGCAPVPDASPVDAAETARDTQSPDAESLPEVSVPPESSGIPARSY